MRVQTGRSTPPAEPRTENPFVEMSGAARLALVIYFVLWTILPDALSVMRQEVDGEAAVYMQLVLRLAYNGLLILPLFLRSFGGLPIGWLHPLVLPLLLTTAVGIMKEPIGLLDPVTVWFAHPAPPPYELLSGWPREKVEAVELKRDGLNLLAIVSYMIAFAFFRRPARILPSGQGLPPHLLFAFAFTVLVAVFVIFLQINGGLIRHMSVLAQGRFDMRETSGHFLVLIQFAPYLLILWYLYRPRILWRPWFLAIFFVSMAMQFVATGSRSDTLMPAALLVAAWMFRTRRVPAVTVLFGALSASLLLGALGEVRRSASENRGVVSFSALQEFDLQDRMEATQEEMASRASKSGSIAIMAKVPNEVGHLLGRTYVSAIAFFIPRSLWRDKPRGAGAHVTSMLYRGWPLRAVSSYTGPSYPAGGVGEAYWNFGVLGVIAGFALIGVLHQWFAQRVAANPTRPATILMFLLVVILVQGPQSIEIVTFLQLAVLVALTELFLTRTISQPRSSYGRA